MRNTTSRLILTGAVLAALTWIQPLGAGGRSEVLPPGWAALPDATAEAQNGRPADLFASDRIPEILLSFPLDEYNQLLANFDARPTNEIYVRGRVVFRWEGRRAAWEDVGLRLRGNGFSRNRPEVGASPTHLRGGNANWQKAHFRVNIDKFVKSHEFFGLETFNLKMFNGDPSYVREPFAMDLFERFGVFTFTRWTYVRLWLYVEGDPAPVDFGLYRLNESIDEDFLKDRFARNQKGFLWKNLYPTALSERDPGSRMGVEDPDKGQHFPYDLKTRTDELAAAKVQYLEFIRQLTTLQGEAFEAWADRAVNVELLLRSMAASNALGSMDDYWANKNNWYLYFDEAGIAHYIPYDYDNVLGTHAFQDPVTQDPFDANAAEDARPLIEKFLARPRYRAQYAGYLAELIDPARGLMDPAAARARVAAWRDLVAERVPNAVNPEEHWYDGPAEWSRWDDSRLLGEPNFFTGRAETIRRALQREGFGPGARE